MMEPVLCSCLGSVVFECSLKCSFKFVPGMSSVATARAGKNAKSVNKIGKIMKIFDKVEGIKSQGVICQLKMI